MSRRWQIVRWALLALALLHFIGFAVTTAGKLSASDGLLLEANTPIAGDFINLYAAAQLTLSGRVAEIFDPVAFAAYEATLIPGEIGVRLWAYPPTSLLVAWPFGLGGFFVSLGLWTLLGLVVLALGARRFGFGWIEVAILLLSPAAMHSVFYGQTGNVAAGLLLLALSARRDGDRVAAGSAALLTIKPQLGFLLPVLWLVERRWRLIVLTTGLTVVLAALSVLIWGISPWIDYVRLSLPLLNLIEREATGQFLNMIPSVFIAGRVLGWPADPALLVHAVFAAVVFAVLAWRLVVVKDGAARVAMVLLATALISPYLHSYDLTIVAAGALVAGRLLVGPEGVRGLLMAILVVAVWGLPNLLQSVNKAGVPLGPLPILLLFLAVAFLVPSSDHKSA